VVLVLIKNAGFVLDNGTKYAKGVRGHRGLKPVSKKHLRRLVGSDEFVPESIVPIVPV